VVAGALPLLLLPRLALAAVVAVVVAGALLLLALTPPALAVAVEEGRSRPCCCCCSSFTCGTRCRTRHAQDMMRRLGHGTLKRPLLKRRSELNKPWVLRVSTTQELPAPHYRIGRVNSNLQLQALVCDGRPHTQQLISYVLTRPLDDIRNVRDFIIHMLRAMIRVPALHTKIQCAHQHILLGYGSSRESLVMS